MKKTLYSNTRQDDSTVSTKAYSRVTRSFTPIHIAKSYKQTSIHRNNSKTSNTNRNNSSILSRSYNNQNSLYNPSDLQNENRMIGSSQSQFNQSQPNFSNFYNKNLNQQINNNINYNNQQINTCGDIISQNSPPKKQQNFNDSKYNEGQYYKQKNEIQQNKIKNLENENSALKEEIQKLRDLNTDYVKEINEIGLNRWHITDRQVSLEFLDQHGPVKQEVKDQFMALDQHNLDYQDLQLKHNRILNDNEFKRKDDKKTIYSLKCQMDKLEDCQRGLQQGIYNVFSEKDELEIKVKDIESENRTMRSSIGNFMITQEKFSQAAGNTFNESNAEMPLKQNTGFSVKFK